MLVFKSDSNAKKEDMICEICQGPLSHVNFATLRYNSAKDVLHVLAGDINVVTQSSMRAGN